MHLVAQDLDVNQVLKKEPFVFLPVERRLAVWQLQLSVPLNYGV